MPPDRLDQAIDVLQEFPREAGLADPCRSDDADQAGPALTARGMEQVPELAHLLVTPDERSLEPFGATDPAALGDDPDRTPGGHGRDLALERQIVDGFEHDRLARGTHRRLADEHAGRRCRALESAGRIDHVARDHPLIRRTQGDGCLTGQDADPQLDPRSETPDRPDQVESGADGPFGVILAGDRRAPEGHHRIADELLDPTAIAVDDVPDCLEVAGLEVADLLRVTTVRECGEADQVGEQDGHEPSLGGLLLGAERGRRRSDRPPSDVAPGQSAWRSWSRTWRTAGSTAPQDGQIAANGVAHSMQNRAPGRFSVPQFGQTCPLTAILVSGSRRPTPATARPS